MSLGAATGAVVAGTIGAAGSIGGSLLSRPSSAQNNALKGQTALDAQLASNAQQGSGLATQYTNLATPAITNALNYWQKILSGNPTSMSSVLGPTISNINQGIGNALNTTQQFAPRGGARNTAISNLPFNQLGQIGNLYATLQPAAATEVGDIGTGTAGLGAGFLNGSSSSAGTGANAYLGLVSTLQGLRNQQTQNGANIGTGLYTWAKGIDWSSIFGGGGSTVNPNPNDPSICYIAIALWGANDIRTQRVRRWLNQEYRFHPVGRYVVRVYELCGKQVGASVRKYGLVRKVVEPIFNLALRKAS